MSAETLSDFILRKISTFCRIVGGLLFLGVIISTYCLMYFSNDIPDYSSLQNYNPPTITRLYSQNLELMTEYGSEPRIFVKVNDIPKNLINAFVAAEDKTFFENYGIDPIGILRSAVKSIENLSIGKRAIGASTITQQVVQSFIVGKKRTLDRKISEAILAYRISMKMSKEKILELYLNQIFLGNNSYGVAQAAKTYFNKELSHLNIAECAMIASLPKAPSAFSPYSNPERLLERRNWVLQRMNEEGMIGIDEMIEYGKMELGVIEKKSNNSKKYLFYTEEVRKQLMEFYGEDAINTKGLTVNTNMDEEIQAISEESLRYGIEAYDKRHGWRGPLSNVKGQDLTDELKKFSNDFTRKNGPLVNGKLLAIVTAVSDKEALVSTLSSNYKLPLQNIRWARRKLKGGGLGPIPASVKNTIKKGDIIVVTIDKDNKATLDQIPEVNGAIVVMENYTGRVLALVGGYNPYSTYFNRATQGERQPGSAFKTLIYLAGIENGFSKDSILIDEPIEISQGKGMPNWRPQNLTHEFNGPVTMEEAFTRSLNIPAIQLGVALGLDKVYEISSRLGLYPKANNPDIPCKKDAVAGKYCRNYSLLLGSFETTLMKLTSAYGTIASGGYEIQPSLISSIYDNRGELLYKNPNIAQFQDKVRIFTKKLVKTTANNKMIDMMESALAPQARQLKLKVAGKTGTTNDSLDTWFIGSTKDFTIGIFIGYDLPQSLGKKEIGATVARPVFIKFINSIMKNIEDGPIGKLRPAIEMINTGEEMDEAIDSEEAEDIESISEILKKKPEIKLEIGDPCPDCEDAFSIKSYMTN